MRSSSPVGEDGGCAKLMQAAELANEIKVENGTTIVEKRAHLAAGVDAIQLARIGLRTDCSFDKEHESQAVEAPYQHFRSLLRLFLLEAEIAQREEKTEKALDAYLDYSRLSSILGRGGNMDNQLTSTAYLSKAATAIHSIQELLTNEQCTRAKGVLESVLESIEPVDVVVRRETGQSHYPSGSQEHSLIVRQEDYIKNCRALLELCRSELAIRSHYLKNGRLPTGWDDMVGEELSAVPIDPWSGQPLVYRVEGGEYRVFAAGPSGEVRL